MADLSELTPSSDSYILRVNKSTVVAKYIGDYIVHLKIPHELLSNTIVPGVAKGADVEIVVIKDLDTLTNHLHLLGSRWLADSMKDNINTWLHILIQDSALMRTWDKDKIWIAVPLERKNKQEYCMPMVEPDSKLIPLMSCKTALIADQYSELADSTLAHCSNSIGYLMGKCKLGCSYCSIGLGSATIK